MTSLTAKARSVKPAGIGGVLDEARSRWAGMAGRIGMGFAAVGFFVILLAWNGAAGLDYTQGQVPYLISGGIGGLGLIVMGAALIIAESNRRDRAVLEARLADLLSAVERLSTSAVVAGGAGGAPIVDAVVAGRSSFHDPSCHLVEGRPESAQLSRADAEAAGLKPCRVCVP